MAIGSNHEHEHEHDDHDHGTGVVPFYGEQQAGIATPAHGHALFASFALLEADMASGEALTGADFDARVWETEAEPSWFEGGTYLVFRKIRMRLPNWSLTTAEGSAIFAVPPGASEGGFVGEGLFR